MIEWRYSGDAMTANGDLSPAPPFAYSLGGVLTAPETRAF